MCTLKLVAQNLGPGTIVPKPLSVQGLQLEKFKNFLRPRKGNAIVFVMKQLQHSDI